MSKKVKEINEKQCRHIIKKLEKREMGGHYCETVEEAKALALSMIAPGDLVSWGGSVTVDKVGIKGELENLGAKTLDVWQYKDPEESRKAKVEALSADVFFMSCNAITLSGELVNIDGAGNRMAALLFGPKKIIVFAGVNKIVTDVEDGIKRTQRQAAPPNCSRLGFETPCAQTGVCTNCLIPGQTSCCTTVVTRFCRVPRRIEVILINESLGF